jgi:hypothetical protein
MSAGGAPAWRGYVTRARARPLERAGAREPQAHPVAYDGDRHRAHACPSELLAGPLRAPRLTEHEHCLLVPALRDARCVARSPEPRGCEYDGPDELVLDGVASRA